MRDGEHHAWYCPAIVSGIQSGHVQFYNIEMGRLADGMISVAITATTCPYEGELVTQELHADRTRTFDEALAFVKNSLVIH